MYAVGFPPRWKVETKRQTLRAHGRTGPCVVCTSACSGWPKFPQLSLICGTLST